MKRRSFTGQQIIGFLKEAEAEVLVKELCRKHGFSDATFYGKSGTCVEGATLKLRVNGLLLPRPMCQVRSIAATSGDT